MTNLHGDINRMQHTMNFRVVLFGAAAVLVACSDANTTQPAQSVAGAVAPVSSTQQSSLVQANGVQVVRGTGDITAAVNQYRALLGTLNPNLAGEQPGGRREINWDGVPAARTNVDNFPGNFFNVNSPRGVLFTTPGTGFRISDNGYTDVNPNYAGEFNFFSPTKLFVSVGSTIMDVQFVVAGSNTPARVTGFGSVFADVAVERSTTIEYFDETGRSLLLVAAPKRTDAAGLSFVGATFPTRSVSRVRITVGDTPIGANSNDLVIKEGKHDIVATDDFIYGEPRARK
ncbi:MAG: hypothetical protein ABJE47_16330 [bacterium]